MARLAKTAKGWEAGGGTLAGVTRLSDLVAEFARLGLCEATDAVAYNVVQTIIQTAADMLSTGAHSPHTPCDALSLALSVRGREARMGALVSVPEPTAEGCSP